MKECPVCHRCFADGLNHCPGDGDALKFLFAGEPVLDGRYRLEQKIGHGGMGMVFKARHVHIKTTHAVKVILPDLVGNDPTLTTRFRQEAMAAAAIRHPHTVSVTDYGVVNETTPYLVMEYVEGRSLHDLLAQQKRLPPALAVEIMLAVCEGVAAAHRVGIVHRDLKPLNILLKNGESPRDGVKVLDFGLAKIKSGELLGSFVAAQTQGLMGSPYYMAPEQWSDEGVDERADIYSLGVLLYQMLAGDVPFKGGSIPSIMNRHLTTAPAPFSAHGVEGPTALEGVVRHALEKDPTQRPQTVEEFMAELRAALATLGGEASQAESGVQTIQFNPNQTMGGPDRRGAVTGAGPHPDENSIKTVVAPRDNARPVSSEAAPGAESGAQTAAGPFAGEPPSGATPEGADFARGGDTAHQPNQRTTHGGPHAPRPHAGDEARTEPLPPGGVFVKRETQGESGAWGEFGGANQGGGAGGGAGTESGTGPDEGAPEAAARAAAPPASKPARSLVTREHKAVSPPAAPAAPSVEPPAAQHTPAAAAHDITHAAHAAAHGAHTPSHTTPSHAAHAPSQAAPGRSSGPSLLIAAAVLVLFLAGVGAMAYYFATRGDSESANAGDANANNNAAANAGDRPAAARAEMISLPGGSFRVGRDDVPPLTDEARRTRPNYLLWVYQQWPAHAVAVAPFAIDKTEVTNEEYAGFVREAGRSAPATWGGDAPPQGSERMPVTGVDYEDALAFAAWRSKRDGVAYRLPTEAEWEYAARGGEAARLFPWGAAWAAGRANLGGAGPAPVGSFSQGATPQGVEDMVGNVWELTSSEAGMYEGNDRTVLGPADRGKVVARGGSYESRHDGEEPVTATSRRWVAKDFRSPVLGFRLVRPAG